MSTSWSYSSPNLADATLGSISQISSGINSVAEILGIKATSIAVAISEEVQDKYNQWAVRDFAVNGLYETYLTEVNTHSSILNNYTFIKSLPLDASERINPDFLDKMHNVVVSDFGIGNIKLETAIDYIIAYSSTSDILNLNQYK